ncbi:hypothetical protein AG4045_030528 [Apium graveolens]|uniref:beta-galactosidase n=1 Tax=Apium graveolens TaxID=4045 RepID=A0A6L5BAH8_APIGR|nr:hypothetical protein AG4045_030528 [Apium graveolens]
MGWSVHWVGLVIIMATASMWPSLISKAKGGGLQVIQTYVFWNLHEPQPGLYDFSGRKDIVGFIKEIQAQGLYLRMQNFTAKIVNMMKSEGLYASQGGPIILSQSLQLTDADIQDFSLSDLQINACNGLRCGETFAGPNSPNKPSLWTENWTSNLQTYGDNPVIRSAEDIAYHAALFILTKNGSFINYYMYHGGTNFGRTAAAYMITSYYDQAPLDEYAFLVNTDKRKTIAMEFRNSSYQLPPKSISILPDCKTVAFNTAKACSITNQYKCRLYKGCNLYRILLHLSNSEPIPQYDETSIKANILLEQTNATKDVSDYLWYTFSFQRNSSNSKSTLSVPSLGHALHAYVNGVFVGSAHGSRTRTPSLLTQIQLNTGINKISLLSVMVGLKVGLLGEKLQVYTSQGWSKVKWNKYNSSKQLTWYHVPRSFLKPTGNLLVLLDEEYGNPLGITLDTVSVTKVCSHVSDSSHPITSLKGGKKVAEKHEEAKAHLRCPSNKIISRISFASFGTPSGNCEKYSAGSCHSSNSKAIVERACVGKGECMVALSYTKFQGDPCPGIPKDLLIEAQCHSHEELSFNFRGREPSNLLL